MVCNVVRNLVFGTINMFGSSFCLLTEKVTDNVKKKKERASKFICFLFCVAKKEKVTDEKQKKKKPF